MLKHPDVTLGVLQLHQIQVLRHTHTNKSPAYSKDASFIVV